MKWIRLWVLITVIFSLATEVSAQSFLQERRERVRNTLSARYYRNNDSYDTTYITRPETKWTVVARMNVSGAKIETEGMESARHFKSEMKADYKSTLSVGVSYLGFSLNASINPAKLMGKYRDYELNFNTYGRRFGFDLSYQDAHNFTGWHDADGQARLDLPADVLSVKTLNVNTFYVFNSRRFSYPAAFSQSYIQRQSAGSFLLALSGQGQHASLSWGQEMNLKMTNIGIGAGYGYNYVPSRNWLLHISALPTFIVYSNTSLTIDDVRIPLDYYFPEVIITGRGAVVRQWKNKFFGISGMYNFTNIGNKDNLAIYNLKWRARAFFGWRF